MQQSAAIRIMLLSTDPSLTGLVARVLQSNADVSLVLSAEQWSELVENPLLPQAIVLLDMELIEESSAFALIREARSLGARVITLSSGDSPALVMKAMAAGADAALRKTDSSRRLADQLRLSVNRDLLIRQREK